MMVAKIVQNKGGKSCPMCWALLLQGHMLCKGGIAGILLRKTKEENHNETNHNNSSVTGNLYREPVL